MVRVRQKQGPSLRLKDAMVTDDSRWRENGWLDTLCGPAYYGVTVAVPSASDVADEPGVLISAEDHVPDTDDNPLAEFPEVSPGDSLRAAGSLYRDGSGCSSSRYDRSIAS